MRPPEVWQHFCAPGDKEARAVARAALMQAGLDANAVAEVRAQQTGVVFFTQVTRELQGFVREASRYGLNRVLAVSVARLPLAAAETWQLLKAGAGDVLSLHGTPDLGAAIKSKLARWQQVEDLLNSNLVRKNLVGESPAWRRILRQVVETARFTDESILITGESGTGKEQIARLAHTLDEARNKHSLVVLDCATVTPELSGSEFFGHERGAFTGAVATRDGAFARADGGTLFLDEIGELPLKLQAELLRAIQERTYKRVGGNNWYKTDCRLICATNRDLLAEKEQGGFRPDLYYRIAEWTCHLPPLHERTEDILPLARHFLSETGSLENCEIDGVISEYLLQKNYSGNVRELLQLVRRIAHRHVGPGPITAGDIPEEERPARVPETVWPDEHFVRNIKRALLLGASLKEITERAETTAERLALEEAGDNVARAAEKLGVHRRTLEMHRAAWRQHSVTERNGSSS